MLLRAGVHVLKRTLHLTAADSGTTYTTHPDDVAKGRLARMTGGIKVPASAFKPAKPSTGVPGILVANLFALGLNASSLGTLAAPYPKDKLELFYGGQPMTLARDPNIGTDHFSTWHWAGYENATRVDDLTLGFKDTDTGARWSQAMKSSSGQKNQNATHDLWLHGYTKFDWRDSYFKLASVEHNSTSGHYTLHRDPSTSPQYPWVSGCRFYAVGALELLDAPGEFWVNTTSGELFFLPPGGALTHEVVVSVLTNTVLMDGVCAERNPGALRHPAEGARLRSCASGKPHYPLGPHSFRGAWRRASHHQRRGHSHHQCHRAQRRWPLYLPIGHELECASFRCSRMRCALGRVPNPHHPHPRRFDLCACA